MESKDREPLFSTITSDDWKRSLEASRSASSDITKQLKAIMEDKFKTQFASLFGQVQKEVNQTAHDKGWYESGVREILNAQDEASVRLGGELAASAHQELETKEDGARIALMHSELSEALEGLRAGNPPSDKIGVVGFSQVEEEFADCIIRIMDVSQERGWRIGEAIEAKRAYNAGRSHRHGGKKL